MSPKVAYISSSDSKGEVDDDVGKIYDREDSKESVMEYVSDLATQFLNVRSVDKKNYPLLLLAGGSGMGKSFLLDVISLMWAKECLAKSGVEDNNYIAIPITFNAKTSLVDDELKLTAESKLCLRALYFLFGATMGFANFVTQVVNRFQFPISLDVIIEYCHNLHGKKVVVFLVDELLKITEDKDPADIHRALSVLGRVSQGYTSSTDCLVMGIVSSLVVGLVGKWETNSGRRIIWCGLNLFSNSTMDTVFQSCPIVNTLRFQNVMYNTSGRPKSISQLIKYIQSQKINTEEALRGRYVDILQQLQPNSLPQNELFTQIIQFCLKARDHMYVEDEKITGIIL